MGVETALLLAKGRHIACVRCDETVSASLANSHHLIDFDLLSNVVMLSCSLHVFFDF
jgi:hypothetical protein